VANEGKPKKNQIMIFEKRKTKKAKLGNETLGN
jgi:hypothetical protein